MNSHRSLSEEWASMEEKIKEQEILIQDCAMLLRRWLYKTNNIEPLTQQTKDFLKRKNLQGSPLR